MKNEILGVSGMSCVGKTTILLGLDKAVSPLGKPLEVMTSDVTRNLRGEYEWFRRHVSPEEHAQRAANGEYAESICYGSHYYSVRKADVEQALDRGHHVLVDCVPEGLRQFREYYAVRGIFVFASPAELCQRHRRRGTGVEEMRWRLQNAAVELEDALNSGLYGLFIHNADLERSTGRIMEYLDGKPVASDPIDAARFRSELQEVLEVLDRLPDSPVVKSKKSC